MRPAIRLLATVRGRGIRAEAHGAKLHLVAPPGTLDAHLKAELAAHKAELLAELAAEADDHRERAHVLIAATFEKVTAFWNEAATLPPVELEAAIDDAALAGDLSALRQTLAVYEAAARHAVEAVSPPVPAAVRLTGTAIGDVWLIADAETLADNPDIAASGLPVLPFADVARLAELPHAALVAVAKLTAVMPERHHES